MDIAEACREEGNALFASGNGAGAIAAYERGIEALCHGSRSLTMSPEDTAQRHLLVVLYSNLANARLTANELEACCTAALAATALDPSALKPWLRLVEARCRAGFYLDALVHYLRHVRPLLGQSSNCNKRVVAKETQHALRSSTELTLYDALGLSRVSGDFELADCTGGYALRSRRAFAANEVLFVEQKYRSHFDEANLSAVRELTTEKMIVYFAQHLRPEQERNSDAWRRIRRDFCGAWPRSLSEIDIEVRHLLTHRLRQHYPTLADAALNELLMIAMICRYNCFQDGFFRLCALANHSCRANIAMKYDPVHETMVMITVRDVAAGEYMNVKYLNDAQYLMGLGRRRLYLRSWLFWCTCERCAEDNDAACAVQEYVMCPTCHAYTHMPLFEDKDSEHNDTPQEKIDDTRHEVDPLRRYEVRCASCQTPLQWDEARLAQVHAVLALITTSIEESSVTETMQWMRHCLELAAAVRVHPGSWLYRVVFYFFCVPLAKLVQHGVLRLRTQGGAVLLASVHPAHPSITTFAQYLHTLFEPVGLASLYLDTVRACDKSDAEAARSLFPLCTDVLIVGNDAGCDALRMLGILWHLICGFYPCYEMWTLHKAICELVMLQLLCHVESTPKTATAASCLSNDVALRLLQRHGAYLGEDDVADWLHMYKACVAILASSRHASRLALPSVAAVRQAFRSSGPATSASHPRKAYVHE